VAPEVLVAHPGLPLKQLYDRVYDSYNIAVIGDGGPGVGWLRVNERMEQYEDEE
jgi:hypothetical protein